MRWGASGAAAGRLRCDRWVGGGQVATAATRRRAGKEEGAGGFLRCREGQRSAAHLSAR